MSNYVEDGQFRAFRKQVRTTIIAGIKLFHMNTAPTLRAQGRSGYRRSDTIRRPGTPGACALDTRARPARSWFVIEQPLVVAARGPDCRRAVRAVHSHRLWDGR